MERKEANAIDWDRYRSGASGGRIFGKWAKQVLWVSGVCSELPMLSCYTYPRHTPLCF